MAQMPVANSADPWQVFLSDIRGVATDYLRFKLIDVERPTDDRNIPDQADLRYGVLAEPAGLGLTLGAWLVIGAAAIIGVMLVARMK